MSFPRYPEYKDSGVEWLGEVPGHWQLAKLKHLARFAGGGTPSRDNPSFWGGSIPWVSPKDMKVASIETAEESITEKGLGGSSTGLIPPGRVLMVVRSGILKHTIPVAINAVEVALNQDMKALDFSAGACSAEFFFRWVQGLNDFLLLEWAKQGATVESIEHAYLAETLLPLPPAPEQAAIATFLDRETAKIDALVAEQQSLIALLKEKRQALISHAVTKGLDPDVPMKDSEVAWLGEVPVHWVVLALSRIATGRCDGPFGSGIKSEHYTDSGALVVRLQNIRSNGFYVGEPAFLELEYFEQALKRHEVVPGDVLIAGLGDENNVVGRACVAPPGISPALVKADCFRFRLDGSVAAAAFVAAQLNVSAVADAGRLANGSTRSRIPLSVMATRAVALPPLAEQVEIVAFVERELAAIDELVGEADTTIALLQERRTALISAAVTGKIDVRHLAAASAEPTPEPA